MTTAKTDLRLSLQLTFGDKKIVQSSDLTVFEDISSELCVGPHMLTLMNKVRIYKTRRKQKLKKF